MTWKTKISRLVYSIRSSAPSVTSDVLFVAGLAGVAYGFWMVYHPLGPIAAGAFAVAMAKLISPEKKKR